MATPSNNPYAPRRSGASPSSSAAAEQTIGKFKRMEHIGKGSFAEVYRGIHIVRSSWQFHEGSDEQVLTPRRRSANLSPSSQSI
jgi:hypothetical protein